MLVVVAVLAVVRRLSSVNQRNPQPSPSNMRALPAEPTRVDVEGSVGWVISEADRAVASVDLGTDGTARSSASRRRLGPALRRRGRHRHGGPRVLEVVRVTGAEVGPLSALVPDAAGKLILATDTDGVWVATIEVWSCPPTLRGSHRTMSSWRAHRAGWPWQAGGRGC